MLSFTGYPRPTIPVQKHRFDLNVENQLANVEKAERATIYGKAAAKQMKKEDWAGFLERNSRRKVVCDNCLKPQTPEQKYPRCARCWDNVKREINYCSRFVSLFSINYVSTLNTSTLELAKLPHTKVSTRQYVERCWTSTLQPSMLYHRHHNRPTLYSFRLHGFHLPQGILNVLLPFSNISICSTNGRCRTPILNISLARNVLI